MSTIAHTPSLYNYICITNDGLRTFFNCTHKTEGIIKINIVNLNIQRKATIVVDITTKTNNGMCNEKKI